MNQTTPATRNTRSPRQPRRATTAIVLLVSIVGVCTSVAVSQQGSDANGASIQSARESMARWVEVRKQISREQQQWALGKEMLNERIDLVRRELDSLRERLAKTEQNITDADDKREKLTAANDKFKDASAALESQVQTLDARTRALLKRLPAPLRKELEPLSQQLPDNPDQTDQSLSRRFQTIIGILNQANNFNSEITLTSEVRDLPEGKVNVRVLYVGLGQAFYVNADRTVGGTGTASSEGWVWTPANHAAPKIADAIGIYENEQVAAFVSMPVEIE